MRIALLGYGKMGKMIERIAIERGHEIVLIVDENNRAACTDEQLKQADVAIEFTMPAVAVENYKWCFDNGVPVVSGTTGWLERWDEVVACCREQQGGFLYASNFSIGVNIFFQLNKYLAKMMNGFNDYKVFIEETHHIHKLDAPSGTAITIAEGILVTPASRADQAAEAGPGSRQITEEVRLCQCRQSFQPFARGHGNRQKPLGRRQQWGQRL